MAALHEIPIDCPLCGKHVVMPASTGPLEVRDDRTVWMDVTVSAKPWKRHVKRHRFTNRLWRLVGA